MGGKTKAPEPPDYSGVALASKRAARYNYQLGREQLDWARQQYAGDRSIIDRVINASLDRQAINDEAALQDRERYEGQYQGLEDQAVRDAQTFVTPERQRYDMSRASASVAQQFDASRDAALQNLEAFGVDPSSTRYAALDANSRIQQAAAMAGAENQARGQTEALGRAMRSEAINVGRGYPGQIAGTYGTALQSGASAANSALAGTASGAATMGTNTQYQGLGNQGVGAWGNALNMGYNNQFQAAQFNAQNSSGLGSLFGAGLGAIGNAGGLAAFFQDGGAVTSGGNVPPQASPSRGAAVDDVSARLNVGEFVIPTDVVEWKGEEFFQRLIEQSRKAKPQAPAKPEYAAVPAQPPAFQSQPAQPQSAQRRTSALPMG